MQHFIVVGNPIAHSKSPDIHHAFANQLGFDICYRRQLCPNDNASFVAVVEAFFNGGGVGANITLPFKQMAYQLCANTGELSDEARIAGAVNTLAWRHGKLYGDNTDGKGLVYDLTQLMMADGEDLSDKSVLILGAGGATRGVILPLLQAGVTQITIANRTYSKAADLAAHFDTYSNKITAICLDDLANQNADIVINATSATTTNQALALPATLTARLAYDMMYGKPSPFLAHFAKHGAIVADGLGMLLSQAAYAFGLWMNVDVKRLDLAAVQALLLTELTH